MHTPDPVAGRVLVVDDMPQNRQFLRRMLARDGHDVVEADSGRLAIEIASERDPDVVILDVLMPGLDGFQTCEALKQRPETRLTPVVLLTALSGRKDKLRGLEAGADEFLSKPVDPVELSARVRSLVSLKRRTRDLDSAEAVIMSLALTIEARDPETEGHCERLSHYATVLGRHLGLPAADLQALDRGGVLHDIGKVGVPDAILLKRGPLTAEETAVMRRHTLIGDRLCANLRSLRAVRPIVRSHHERLDGSGYPDGLRGGQVPLLAQIIGIVDVFDALTTPRPYKPAFTPAEALAELRYEVARGRHSSSMVEAFAAMLTRAAA